MGSSPAERATLAGLTAAVRGISSAAVSYCRCRQVGLGPVGQVGQIPLRCGYRGGGPFSLTA